MQRVGLLSSLGSRLLVAECGLWSSGVVLHRLCYSMAHGFFPEGVSTCVPCVRRQISCHWTTRKVPSALFLFILPHRMTCGILVMGQGSNPCPLQWTFRVPTTGLLGKRPVPLLRGCRHCGLGSLALWAGSFLLGPWALFNFWPI